MASLSLCVPAEQLELGQLEGCNLVTRTAAAARYRNAFPFSTFFSFQQFVPVGVWW